MKPPRLKMTTRALIVATALFGLDFAGIAWVLRPQTRGALGGVGVLAGLLITFFATILLLFAMIYLYVPPPIDEALIGLLTVLVILIILVLLIVPGLQHS